MSPLLTLPQQILQLPFSQLYGKTFAMDNQSNPPKSANDTQAHRVLNLAFYQFVDVPQDLIRTLKQELKEFCQNLDLKGTILLTPEGINCFLAGTSSAIHAFISKIETTAPFGKVEPRLSWSANVPFTRLLIKVKKEIIAFGDPTIRPIESTAPRLSPQELKRWYDEGKEFAIVDTRNDYEFKLGTFKNAITFEDLKHFRTFTQKLDHFEIRHSNKPIVMFCTGGIRCEKATAIAERKGFKNVYQLEGGILKYFETCGGEHYQGECFVFDHRVALNSKLEESDSLQCFDCREPMTKKEAEAGHRCKNPKRRIPPTKPKGDEVLAG